MEELPFGQGPRERRETDAATRKENRELQFRIDYADKLQSHKGDPKEAGCMQQLLDMGFNDFETCLQITRQHGNDLNKVLDHLYSNGLGQKE